jgi:hypothetical protein
MTYHGGTSEGSNVLERSGLGSSSGDDDGVLHGIILFKGLDQLSDSGALLTDSNVDAVQLLLLVGAYQSLVFHLLTSPRGENFRTVVPPLLTTRC